MNGIISEVDLTTQQAMDGRHPAVIRSFALPENGNAELKVGELLFEGSNTVDSTAKTGATPEAKANTKSVTGTGDGSKTAFNLDFGQEIFPGSLAIATNDSTPLAIADDGEGGLSGDGTGTIDYVSGKVAVTFTTAPANTKTITAVAVPGQNFIGVNNIIVEENYVLAIVGLHGSLFEGIAKVNGAEVTEEQIKFLARHGIY